MEKLAPTGNLDDLRAALFSTLRGLRDEKNPLPVETATATVHVARELIATGRLELDFLKMMSDKDKKKSAFFGSQEEDSSEPTSEQITQRSTATGQETVQTAAGGRILQHRMR